MKFTALACTILLSASTCFVGIIDVDPQATDTIATRVRPAKPVLCFFIPSSSDCTKF